MPAFFAVFLFLLVTFPTSLSNDLYLACARPNTPSLLPLLFVYPGYYLCPIVPGLGCLATTGLSML